MIKNIDTCFKGKKEVIDCATKVNPKSKKVVKGHTVIIPNRKT